MLKKTFVGFMFILFAFNSFANDSFKCGLANTLGFDGKGMNAVTNFYFSGSTYHSAVTSGTSGCDGLVLSEEVKVDFIAKNYDVLKEQASIGSGEHLYALSTLLGCPVESNETFAELTKEKYSLIFENANNTNQDILDLMKSGINTNPNLSNSCQIQS
jgi:hypothetical protein